MLGNYFPDRFPTFWERFDESVAAGEVLSVREVEGELELYAPAAWILERLKRQRGFFGIPDAAESAFVAQIFSVKHFQALVGEKERLAGKPVADPFLIARAKILDGCVVTEEVLKPNAAKIPNVCKRLMLSAPMSKASSRKRAGASSDADS